MYGRDGLYTGRRMYGRDTRVDGCMEGIHRYVGVWKGRYIHREAGVWIGMVYTQVRGCMEGIHGYEGVWKGYTCRRVYG